MHAVQGGCRQDSAKWARQLTGFIFILIRSISFPHCQSLSGRSASDWRAMGVERRFRTCGQVVSAFFMLSRSRVLSLQPCGAHFFPEEHVTCERSRGLCCEVIGLCTDGKHEKKDLIWQEAKTEPASALLKWSSLNLVQQNGKKLKSFLQPSETFGYVDTTKESARLSLKRDENLKRCLVNCEIMTLR